VFLFDEPLSNLDAKLRAELRVEIKRLHNRLGNTMIYVTHDQIEAMTLADRIAIMKGGLILQFASPLEIYSRPANKYVADFIGSPPMNFLEGKVDGGRFSAAGIDIQLKGYEFAAAGKNSGSAWFGIRPEHVFTGDEAKKQGYQTEVDIEIVEPMGADTLVWATLAGNQFRLLVDGAMPVSNGQSLKIGFDPSRASLFHRESEERM